MAHSDAHSQQEAAVHEGFESTSGEAGVVDDRKLVVLGLPWVTDEASLRKYFSQFGPLQECVVMKDRASGKSRGFGFVTYWSAADAQRVLEGNHVVDGRRCEPKLALPRGGPPQRTSRLFIARIPPSVTEEQFRQYFESFGCVQDAYMPKDSLKQAHRGIGFVTYTSPDPVDVVLAMPHSLHGVELAVDMATAKEGRVGYEAARQVAGGVLPAHGLGPAAARHLQQFMAAFPPASGFAAPASAPAPAPYPSYGQGRAHPGLSYSNAVGGAGYEAASNGGGMNPTPASGASPYASASSNGGPANGGSAYSSSSNGGRFESGGSEAGTGAGVSGGYGAALGARPSLEDVSPPGAGERHNNGGISALQDYLRDAPANDRTAQALQGLTFGGGGEGIGLRIGGLLQAQAQAQFGGDLAQQGSAANGALDEQLALLRAAAAGRPPPGHGHTQSAHHSPSHHSGGGAGGPPVVPAGGSAPLLPPRAASAELPGAGYLAGLDASAIYAAAAAGAASVSAAGGGLGSTLGYGSGGRMGRASSDRLSSEGGRYSGGGPADARAGPRMFVGKLNKETTEGDVRDYFTRFGYVMDVYMPRDKTNRAEHRGFAFVTLETEAAVARAKTHGQHQIKGSTIAIDEAAPRREEEVAHSHSQASMTRGLPSIPSIASLHASPGHMFPDASQGFYDMQGVDLSAGAMIDLNAGPARHCLQERLRHGYRPY